MRAPFAYFGGKAGMSELIVSLMPEHRVYIEPFFGSGAVLFAKRPSTIEIANDIDLNVWTFFHVLRTRPDELAEVCSLSPYHRHEFTEADLADESIDELERARRFWVRVSQSFGKTAGVHTGFSVTAARTQSSARSTMSRLGRFGEVAARMQQVVWERCDAAGLVERMATTEDTVVYADPPYLASTRRSRDRLRPRDYLSDMGLDDDHVRLAEALRATPACVILSGYHSPLYDELYADWWRIEIPVRVHASNAVTRDRGERIEVLWSNRDLSPGDVLFTGY